MLNALVDSVRTARQGVEDVKVLVAGSYITREEFVRVMTAWRTDQQHTNKRIFDKLDKIAEKVGAH